MKLGKLYFTLKIGNRSVRDFETTTYKDRAIARKRIEKYARVAGYKVSNFKYVKDSK